MEENKSVVLLKGRLDGKQHNRLKRLLDMLYSPRELAEEIGVNLNQFYMVYIPLGCPHERDNRNHILINGRGFAVWYDNLYTKAEISSDETFCRTCKKAVKIHQPIENKTGQLSYTLSVCPNCGRKLTKITGCSRGKRD